MIGSERTARASSRTWGIAALFVCLAIAVPLLTMVAGSLRQPGLPPPRSFELVPDPVTIAGYRDAFTLAPLARALLNSTIVTAIYVPISLVVASWAGFAIATTHRRTARGLTAATFVLLMVPVTALWIARFAIFESLGLVGTYVPLIAPAAMGGSPFAVLLYAVAFRRLPPDVVEAARLEGAGPMQIWRRVAMPLVGGTTAAVAMLAFVQSWTNFVDALLYLGSERTFTAPLVLRYLEQLGSTNWPVLLAGSVIVAAPAVGAFLLVNRWFLGSDRRLGWM